MGLFSQNQYSQNSADTLSPAQLAHQLDEIDNQRALLLTTVRALLVLMKDFTIDLAEMDTADFRGQLDQLSEFFGTETRPKTISGHFNKQKRRIVAYAEDQKQILADREQELKRIIELLSSAMTSLSTDNREFTRKIYTHSEQIEAITRLDDIRRIKEGLAAEVSHIRKSVQTKQDSDQKRVKTLSNQVKVLQEKLDQAETKSMKDSLTGAFNRQAFDDHLRALVERNSVARTPFALLILDIDDFKKVNDNYGHQTGDRVIMALVQKCQESVRSDDFLARYGGEEFVIILPGASLRNGVKKGQHIRKKVAAARYCQAADQGEATISFTVSIGVSTYQQGDSAAAVLKRADLALYTAKAAGKNRVISEKEIG